MYQLPGSAARFPGVEDVLAELPLTHGGLALVHPSDIRRVVGTPANTVNVFLAPSMPGGAENVFCTTLTMEDLLQRLAKVRDDRRARLLRLREDVLEDLLARYPIVLHEQDRLVVACTFTCLWDLNPRVMANPAAAVGFLTHVLACSPRGAIPLDVTQTLLGLPGGSVGWAE